MSSPVSLAERRWEKGDHKPGSHTLRDMLETVIAKLDSGEVKADHMILVFGRETDGVGDDSYFQAGSLGPYGQIGLMRRGLELISQGDD